MTCTPYVGVSCVFLYVVLLALASSVEANLMGIDFGADSYKVVLAPGSGRKQMQLVFNDGSSRKTATVIGFRPNERLFDSDALSLAKFKPDSVYFHLRDLLGRKEAQAAAQKIKPYVEYGPKLFNPKVLDKNNNTIDYPYLAVQHDSKTAYAVHELVAMILAQARAIAEKTDGGRIIDCVITVPVFFTEDERQSLIDSASLAGLNVLSLVDQGAAITAQYATEQKIEEEVKEEFWRRHVVFVDFGENSLQLTLAAYYPSIDEKAKNKKDANITVAQVLGSSWVEIGGRDFTNILVDHFINQLRTKIPDVDEKPRVRAKLRAALKKARETLSANKEVQVNIPNLDGDFDFEATLTRTLFEELSAPLLAQIVPTFETLFKNTGKTKEDIFAFEMLGGTGRIPAVQEVILKYLERETLDRHMNGDEAAVFGATFVGAGLSGRYKNSKYRLKNIVHRNVTATLVTEDAHLIQEGAEDKSNIRTVPIVVRGSKIGLKKTISFQTMQPFQLTLNYVEAENDPLSLADGRTFLDRYFFSGIPKNGTDPKKEEKKEAEDKVIDDKDFEALLKELKAKENKKKKGSKGEFLEYYNMTATPKVIVKLEVTEGGLIAVTGVVEVYHSELVSTPILKNPKTEEGNITEDEVKDQVEEESEDNAEDVKEGEGEDATEEKAPTEDEEEKEEEKEGEKEEEKEKEAEYEMVSEWVPKKTEIPLTIERTYGPLPLSVKKHSREVISEVDRAEKQRMKLQESKNELETRIYAVKNGLEEPTFLEVTSEEQRDALRTLIEELKDWIEYDSDNADTLDVREKKTSLEKLVRPIVLRVGEKEALPQELHSCKNILTTAKDMTTNLTLFHELKDNDLDDLFRLIDGVVDFLSEKREEQAKLQAFEEPILTSELVKKECEKVINRVTTLLKRPRKKPAKADKKEEPEDEDKTDKTDL